MTVYTSAQNATDEIPMNLVVTIESSHYRMPSPQNSKIFLHRLLMSKALKGQAAKHFAYIHC